MKAPVTVCIVVCGLWQAACQSQPRSALPPARSTPYTLTEVETQKRQSHCEWHNQPLLRDVVLVRQGSPDVLYMDAKLSRFPHSESFVFGGRSGEAISAEVLYCPLCRAAEQAWLNVGEDKGR